MQVKQKGSEVAYKKACAASANAEVQFLLRKVQLFLRNVQYWKRSFQS